MGWVIQGLVGHKVVGGVGHTGVGWVMQGWGWGGSCMGGVGLETLFDLYYSPPPCMAHPLYHTCGVM